MDGQYPHSAYMAMSSQPHPPPHFAGYAGLPAQHSQPSVNEPSNLPPIQHQAPSAYGHLPPLYTGAPHTSSPHPLQTSAVVNGQALPTPTGAASTSMPPPSTTYISNQSMYSTSQPSSQSDMQSVGRLQDIRPGAPSAYSNTSPVTPFPSFNPITTLPGQGPAAYIPSQESEPTHVVGSQGRRGILPSVPGRAPAPTAASGAAAKSMIPQKDSEGKFPCPHCNKSYLHAKHLKRHLLRHTGDRPYMCHLCKDTFSRSDILKRHFQKCSIRRGNPTGQNHLAGQRRNTGSSIKRLSAGTMDGSAAETANGTPNSYSNGSTVNGSPTVNGDQSSYASSINSMSARSSRANSLIHTGASFGDRHGLTGLGLSNHGGDHHAVTSGAYAANIPAYAARPHSVSNPVHPSHYGYGPPHVGYQGMKSEEIGSNNYTASPGMSQGRTPGSSNVDWNTMFPHNGQDAFMAQQHAQDQSHVPKAEHHMDGHSFNSTESYNESFLNGMHPQSQAYAEEAGHNQGMLVSR